MELSDVQVARLQMFPFRSSYACLWMSSSSLQRRFSLLQWWKTWWKLLH